MDYILITSWSQGITCPCSSVDPSTSASMQSPQGKGLLPDSELWSLDPGHVFRLGAQWQMIKRILLYCEAPNVTVVLVRFQFWLRSGKPNQSCRQICSEAMESVECDSVTASVTRQTWNMTEAALRCMEQQLEFGNSCEILRQHFKCENGCGHQVGTTPFRIDIQPPRFPSSMTGWYLMLGFQATRYALDSCQMNLTYSSPHQRNEVF